MISSPIFWGPCLACALGGALAGNALGSTPVTSRAAIGMIYQSHESAYSNRQNHHVLPDHYPLTTRSGVVPVAQLSDRGLFSQARYRAVFAAASYATDKPGPGFEEFETAEAAAAPDPAVPLSPPAGPVEVAGNAKIIDVQATLAMR